MYKRQGNSYATAAKRVLASEIDTGLPAGPSEAIILCDEFADPEKAALDFMIEAEHGPDSASLLVTHSKELVQNVLPVLNRQLEKISPLRRSFIETNPVSYTHLDVYKRQEDRKGAAARAFYRKMGFEEGELLI